MGEGEDGLWSRELSLRIMSGVVIATIALAALYTGGSFFVAFVALLGAGAVLEWARLINHAFPEALPRIIGWLAGIAYIGGAVFLFIYFRLHAVNGGVTVFTIIGVVALTDIGAYFSGRTMGGPKLLPRVSPSKTWSGLFGGMVLAGIFAWVVSIWFAGDIFRWSVLPIAALGAVLAVIAQAGDFLESWLKRKAGVKDSGALIPGHGGILDRLDGFIAVIWAVGIMAYFTTIMSYEGLTA